jgi:hypothetical protein
MTKPDKNSIAALDDHLKQWRQISERMTAQMAQMQTELQQSLAPIFEANEKMREAVSISSLYFPKFEFANLSSLPDLSSLAAQFHDVKTHIQGLLLPAFDNVEGSFRDLSTPTKEAILRLANSGWYLDLEMTLPQLWELKKALLDGNTEEAEHALIEYFERRAENIESSLIMKFPLRARLIQAAFKAHQRQEYELSIPVLLAQTDGICKELSDKYLFIKKDKKPEIAVIIDSIAEDTFREALLSPLARTLPINASERERKNGSGALNRHAVLHGESLDYGNKANSLKAISLINYVADVLEDEAKN